MSDPAPAIAHRHSPHSLSNRTRRVLWGITYWLLFRTSSRSMHRWRNWLLRLFGATLHPTARVYPRARCWFPPNLFMEQYATIADDVDIYCVAPIRLGAHACVSQYSYLCGATHDFEDVHFPLVPRSIVIGRRAWVAADVYVGPGVTIGEGTVVGARSSVFDDLPPWVVAVGSPARAVRPRTLGPTDYHDRG